MRIRKGKMINICCFFMVVFFLFCGSVTSYSWSIPKLPGMDLLPSEIQEGLNFSGETPQSDGFTGISKTTLQGCVAGGPIVVLIGKVTGSNKLLRNYAIGTLVGCATGELLNQRREQYKNEVEFYDGQIEETKKNNASLRTLNNQLDAEIARNKEKIKELKALQSEKSKQKDMALREKERAEANADLTSKELAMAKKEIDVQEDLLKEMRKKPVENQDSIKKLEAEVENMRSIVSKLDNQVTNMLSQRDAIGQFS